MVSSVPLPSGPSQWATVKVRSRGPIPYLAAGGLPPRHRRQAAVIAATALEAWPSSQPREDYSLFVHLMHLASPYVVGHRGKTFVIVIPGEVRSCTEGAVPSALGR